MKSLGINVADSVQYTCHYENAPDSHTMVEVPDIEREEIAKLSFLIADI